MPELKTQTGTVINLDWTRPATPEKHRISDVIQYLGDFAKLETGKHWSEATLQDFFTAVSDKCSPALNALKAARDLRPDKDLKPEIAAAKLAEARRKLVEPVLGAITEAAGAEAAKAFQRVDDMENLILSLSEPAPATGNDLVARKIEFASMMPVVMAAKDDLKKVGELATTLLKAGRFDLLQGLQAIAPVIGIDFNFSPIRREWALGKHPELQTLIDARQSMAEAAYSVADKIAGFCRLAGNQAVLHGIDLAALSARQGEAPKAAAEMPGHHAFSTLAKRMTGIRQKEAHGDSLLQAVRGQD